MPHLEEEARRRAALQIREGLSKEQRSLTRATRRTPEKMYMTNLVDGSNIVAQFNPTEFSEAISVNYARQAIPGLSHQPLQYIHTSNETFNLALFFNANDEVEPRQNTFAQIEKNLTSRAFLLSVCYPRRGNLGVVGGGPPRLLFVWPTFIALTCVITGLQFRYSRFNANGTPLEFTATIALEEIRDVRLLSEDVFALGTQRGPDNAGRSGSV